RKKFSGKWKDIALIAILAFTILFAAWRLFDTNGDTQISSTNDVYSDTEKRIGQLLSQMDGVGEADVVVCETEEGVQSVVVVCEGANNLQVIMDIKEAVAAAVGAQEKNVKIYLKSK
ncbi:MAG: hypothetical protein IKA40_02975, partial [Clostridia bacterium]|nr:hypothetical protein [Clostridia bacterium]